MDGRLGTSFEGTVYGCGPGDGRAGKPAIGTVVGESDGANVRVGMT